MNIFESLENLNVSEECFNDIVELIEGQLVTMQDHKSDRRNAEKNAKNYGYQAKQLEKKSIEAEEQGKERKAEYLYDKANSMWDKETKQQQRAAAAQHKVDELRGSN